MSETELLSYIMDELKKSGIVWRSDREIFNILIPNESWEKYKKSWYHWKKKSVKTFRKSKNIKEAISKTLGFDYHIWSSTQEKQKSTIKEAIKLYTQNQKSLIDLSDLMPQQSPLSKKQEQLLEKIKVSSVTKIKEILLNNQECLIQTLENQTFILTLLTFLYQNAFYDLLYELIFPALLPHNRSDKKIKIIEAHTLGIIKKPKYRQSALLLNSVKIDSDSQLIDIKTSAISNIRRYRLSNPNLNIQELKEILKAIIKHYHDTYIYDKRYHYYPAINLLYMIKLFQLIFKDDKEFSVIDISKIQADTKTSIQQDADSKEPEKVYYAKITELEIKMLIYENKIISREFGLLIEILNPSENLLNRTQRTMEEFLEIADRFCKDCENKLEHIKRVVNVFRDKKIQIN